jgi:hypothetical protein
MCIFMVLKEKTIPPPRVGARLTKMGVNQARAEPLHCVAAFSAVYHVNAIFIVAKLMAA